MRSLLTTSLLALIIVGPAIAESPYEHDLNQLRGQRDKALAAASEPVNRRYKELLDQLYQRTVQANDPGTADKIKVELKQLGFDPPEGAGISPAATPAPVLSDTLFVAHLMKQSWTWTSRPGGRDRLDFNKDGTVTHNGWKDAKWVAGKPHTVVITMGATKATLRFNDAVTAFEGLDFGGTHPVKGEHF
jgi:hypothetical protein